jgi:lysophospholipid acyltransferase (LPLAT)-like uncharacterized protein
MHRNTGKLYRSRRVHLILYRLIRLYSWTFRLKVVNEAQWRKQIEDGGRVLICAWHQQFFSAVRYFKNYADYQPALMISRSLDGELVAGVARLSGWHAVRGSSSRGGGTALKKMIRHLRQYGLAGHIVDGPRGPMGIVKPGAIHLALIGKAAIVPFYVSADRAWYAKSWDRFMVPKPFSRVTLKFGNMIPVSKPATDEDFERMRKQLEDEMLKELKV